MLLHTIMLSWNAADSVAQDALLPQTNDRLTEPILKDKGTKKEGTSLTGIMENLLVARRDCLNMAIPALPARMCCVGAAPPENVTPHPNVGQYHDRENINSNESPE